MKKREIFWMYLSFACAFFILFSFPKGALSVDQILIKYADPSKAGTSRTKAAEETMKEIEKRTGGKVKHEFYWSESLLKAKDILKGIQAGTADAGDPTAVVYHPARFPVWQFIQLLFTGGDDQYAVIKACNDLYEANPILKKEFEGQNVKLLTVTALTPTVIISKKPLRDTADFKGLRLRAVGPVAKWAASLGAVPNPMSFYEVTEALARGVLDASQTYIYASYSYKFYEHCKYLPLNGINHIFVEYIINMDTWKKMSPDIQKIYLDTWRTFYVDRCVKYHDEEFDEQISAFKNAGVNIYKLKPEELAKWKEAAVPVNEEWFKKMKEMGIDGKKIVADYQALYDKYERKR
jgi:TRAP-type C4-dicarboxylate transport system substrate-binding protein